MRTTRSFQWSPILVAVLFTGCAATGDVRLEKDENSITLLDPKSGQEGKWEHRRLRRGDTDYRWVETSLGHTVQAVGNESASILFRIFDEIGLSCATLAWQWYVEQPQPSSDLRTKGMDDVAASVFVMFGDPGIFRDEPVPALRYVWANEHHREGDVIVGPYQKEYVRTIVARVGEGVDGALVTERVNLVEDYKKAFGTPPEDGIHGVAIFTDNDDTKEPITAHYGKMALLCGT